MNKVIKKHHIKEISKIEGGWSSDIKYLLVDENDKKYVLRESPKNIKHKKYTQFCYLETLKSLDSNIAKVLEWGFLDNDNIYILFSFIEGENSLDILSKITDEQAYSFGKDAGKILKNIHNIKVIHPTIKWFEFYQNKFEHVIEEYKNSKLKLDKGDIVLEFYKNNLSLIKDRPVCYVHGDYHAGNMLIKDKTLGVIDFDKATIADPYSDFKQCCWNVIENEYFVTGLIDGYFDDNIPVGFFEILKFYTAETLLTHLPWAENKGKQEVYNAYVLYNKTMDWYDNFNLTTPKWYKTKK